MSFSQRLKVIESLMFEDTERCIQMVSSRQFINSLFYQELKSFCEMFEQALSKKGGQSKNSNDGKGQLRHHLIISFYSIIIMRSAKINIRHDVSSSIATKTHHIEDNMYNSKVAIEQLSKIFKSLEAEDPVRFAVTGLLLKVKGFNNYKMIARDLHPSYISQQTLDLHFQAMKAQCPNLLEIQITKYRKQWSKYLKFKLFSLTSLQSNINSLIQIEKDNNLSKWDDLLDQIESQGTYLINRLHDMEDSIEQQKINIDQFISVSDSINQKLMEKIKQHSIVKKNVLNKSEIINQQYDFKQFVLKNYIKTFGIFIQIINKSITTFHINWLRKIKWLFTFIVSLFANFSIKTAVLHESIAKQFSNIINLLVKVLLNYLTTFKNGLFPLGKLQGLAFHDQFSIYKLVEALLYNEYPFNQSEVIVFQNYQKQKRHIDNKQKQFVIDMVNFNMKSLNINPHWDSLLIKIIPNLKNSQSFAKELLGTSLFFFLEYFKLTHNYQQAAKLILLLNNARNTLLTLNKAYKTILQELKAEIYPGREAAKEGIQYFCQEYFNEYFKINFKKTQQAAKRKEHSIERLDFFHIEHVKVNEGPKGTFRKTESRDVIEGWQQNFESIKDSSGEILNGNIANNPMAQSVEMVNSEIFYSIKDGIQQKNQAIVAEIANPQVLQGCNDDEILVPQF